MPQVSRATDCETPKELLVADSFRARLNPRTGTTEVRGLGLHRTRFQHGVAAACEGSLPGVDSFLDDAYGQIAEYGGGFPRWELWGLAGGGRQLRLRLRPLPQLRSTLALVSVLAAPKPNADRKGPNIAHYAELNRELGAEALLVGDGGIVREGATTSVVWWRGGRLYCAPAKDRIASVTETLLGGLLGGAEPTEIASAELAECEVWAVNALHGIRTVTSIDGVVAPAPAPARLAHARAALDQSWQACQP